MSFDLPSIFTSTIGVFSVLYRGCADPEIWPKLNYDYNGCRWQRYGWWDNVPVLWCFCDFDLCNTNISGLSSFYGQTIEPHPNVSSTPSQTIKVNPGWRRIPPIRLVKGSITGKESPDPTISPAPTTDKPQGYHPKYPGIPWDVIQKHLDRMTTTPSYKAPPSTAQMETTTLPPAQKSMSHYPKGTYGIPVVAFPAWLPHYPYYYPPDGKGTTTQSPGKENGDKGPTSCLRAFSKKSKPQNTYPSIYLALLLLTGDPSQDLPTCGDKGCSQICSMLDGRPVCNCRPGYTLQQDGTTCAG